MTEAVQEPQVTPEAPAESPAASAPEPTKAEQLLAGQDDAVETTEESPAETPQPEPSLTERLSRDFGFQDVTDDDAQDRLLQSFQQQQQQLNDLRKQNEQMQALAQYGNQYLQQMQQPQQPQTPQQEQGWWAPPQVDQDLVNKFRVRDENGEMGWRADTPPEIRSRGEEYDQYVNKWADDLVNRPDQLIPKIIEAEFDRLFEQRYQSVSQQEHQTKVMDEIVRSNSAWLYESDPVTKRPAVNVDGSPRLTQAGQMATAYLQQAESMGIQNPEHQWNYVLTALAAQRPAQQAPAQQQQDQKLQHLQQAAQNVPNRSGSLGTPEQPLSTSQNSNLSAGQKLLHELRADGQIT